MALAVPGMLHDSRQELHDELRGDERGVLGGHVEHRVDLHQVEADHLGVARDREERLAQLVVAEPVHLRGGAAGYQGEVQHVDVDAHVDRLVPRNAVQHAGRSAAPVFGNREDVVASRSRVEDVGLARAQAPDTDLDDGADGGELRDVADRVAVRPLDAVHERPVVDMGVEVHDVEAMRVGADDRIGDRVVAADDDGERARLQDLPDVARDVVERPSHVRVDDVRVAAVHDPAVDALVIEVAAVSPDVVEAALPVDGASAGELERQLADLARREARARLPGRALVARRAEDGDVGVQGVQIGARRAPQERHGPGVGKIPARDRLRVSCRRRGAISGIRRRPGTAPRGPSPVRRWSEPDLEDTTSTRRSGP